MTDTSTPTLSEFDPTVIPFQFEVIKDVRKYDYTKGTFEPFLSGAVGSAKSLVAAHIAVTHCLFNPGAVCLIGRRSMPSLKDTLLSMIVEHMGDEVPYNLNKHRGIITFQNKSKIIPFSWADGNYKKVRSMNLSAAIIEEASENEDMEYYNEIRMRVGRLKHVKENFVLSVSNPDDPAHPLYKYFILSKIASRRVYYSKTLDNPFLPDTYVSQLEEMLDPKMARRMLYGEWLSIAEEVVYYSYEREKNFRDETYRPNLNYPIHIAFDFNIGVGKPLSVCFFQHIEGIFHVYEEVIIEGARTESALEDAAGRGLLDHNTRYVVNGDATGKQRHTSSNHSDYEIIRAFLDNYKNAKGNYIRFKIDVPLSNPKIRERHNILNAQLHNAKGQRRLFVYKPCQTVDEGLRLTKLKQGASYTEDDSKFYQHVTTSLGYGVVAALREDTSIPITTHRR